MGIHYLKARKGYEYVELVSTHGKVYRFTVKELSKGAQRIDWYAVERAGLVKERTYLEHKRRNKDNPRES